MNEPAQYPLRLPRDLYAAVQKAADEQGGSVNTFIVAVLAGAVGYREPRQYMPALPKLGSEEHAEEVAERLGLFEIWHLERELQLRKTTAWSRAKAMLRKGLIVEERQGTANVAALYRWVGSKK